jgi:O-antigen/teichoic acid export membrane protein
MSPAVGFPGDGEAANVERPAGGPLRSLGDRARAMVSFVRLSPFETSTEEGRSKERYRRVALSTAFSAAAKAVAAVTVLITVPLTVGYLGTERYGLWMAISSTISLLGFGDLGIGLGLLNAIAEASGKDDREAALQHVASAFYMLLGIGAFLLLLFFSAYPFVSWGAVFNVTSEAAARESGPAVVAFVVCFALNVPLWVVNRVQMGYQEGYVNSAWEIFGNLLGLTGVLVAIHGKAGLPWLVIAMAGAPVLASFGNGIDLFCRRRPWLLPRWGSADRKDAAQILRRGLLFFGMQVTGALAYSSDNLIAARVLGAAEVATYSIPMKLFGFVPLMLGMFLIPLWPAFGEAISRGDMIWVRRTLRRSILISLLLSITVSLPLVLLGPWILRIWVGRSIVPSYFLLSGLGVWAVMGSAWGGVVMFLNGANALRVQAICTLGMGVSALALKVLLARAVGLPGIVWGTVFSQALFVILPLTYYTVRLLSRMGKEGEHSVPGTGIR